MSTKGAPWQHPASAAPQYTPNHTPNRPGKFTLQEGLDNNWVFFPEPHFVNIDEDEEDSSEEDNHEQPSRRDSVNSVNSVSDQQRRPGMQQRGDSWFLPKSPNVPLKDLMSDLQLSSIDATELYIPSDTDAPTISKHLSQPKKISSPLIETHPSKLSSSPSPFRTDYRLYILTPARYPDWPPEIPSLF